MTKIHDRKATDLPAHAIVAPVEVVDPYDAESTIIVFRSIRDDPLERLHVRSQIDEAQYQAGRHLQQLYERGAIGPLKAMDTTKEPVDGGGIRDALGDPQGRAINEVVRLELLIGKNAASICRSVLADGMFLADVARARGMTADRDRRAIAKLFRDSLEKLARELSFA